MQHPCSVLALLLTHPRSLMQFVCGGDPAAWLGQSFAQALVSF